MNPETCIKCMSTDIITDHRSGDVVCRGCGEVQAERLIDLGAEWNRYEDNEGKGDPSRVGGALGDAASRIWGGPSTTSAGGSGGSGAASKRKRKGAGGGSAVTGADIVNKKSKAQSKLEKVCMLLSDTVRAQHMDGRVSQVGFTIADAANTEGIFRGKPEGVLVAAVLYLACKHCGVLKSIAETCQDLDVNKYEVGRIINDISRKVKELEAVVFTPEEVVDKYGGQLRIPIQVRAAAVEVVKAAREVPGFESMHPQTLAGAALLMLCNTKVAPHLVEAGGKGGGGEKDDDGGGSGGGGGGGSSSSSTSVLPAFPPPARTAEEIATATLVTVATVKKTHALLYEHRERLVPAEYQAELEKHHLQLQETKDF